MPRPLFARSVVTAGAVSLLLAAGMSSASAHVHVSPESAEAGANALLTFETAHGCSGSPTASITVTLPDQVTDAVPTAHAGWSISKVTEEFEEPRVLENGTSVGSRTSQVVFTADEPLPDGVRDTFSLSVRIPDAAGDTLVFPVLQSCVEGKTDWSQVAVEGQSADDLELPAPVIAVTAGGTGSDGHGSGDDEIRDVAEEDEVEAAAVAGYAGLGAGVLGLILGAAALYRTRKA
ncbi:uncharacterized protein YcnI [Arthrobacter sp. UYP6]|uniref:YcnI family copper-binding membrane protein n=1 Tax=Arthrobacter sp. UYP6 TaxID=1756378 RepID=UPI003393BE41